jgi:hypothetical protein
LRQICRRGGCFALAFGCAVVFGELTAILLLVVVADIALAFVVAGGWRDKRNTPVEPIADPRLTLHRRTVPHLRSRRPPYVIEMQVRWRARAEAAAARRRGDPW